jgi:hypothetical protein
MRPRYKIQYPMKNRGKDVMQLAFLQAKNYAFYPALKFNFPFYIVYNCGKFIIGIFGIEPDT